MSEIRQDQATKRWVIIATERAKRPTDMAAPPAQEQPVEHSAKCPFCAGNEAMTPPEVLSYRTPDGSGWQVRVVPNRFPALTPDEGAAVEVQDPTWFTTVSGIGVHEVIVESPLHNASPATMSLDQVTAVLTAAGERFNALQQDRRLNYIAFFRNQGLAAGSSLTHPHTQIIATPVAPTNIRFEMEEARRHYDDRLHCVYCELIEKEQAAGARVVLETEAYLAFQPFASRWPFETWVVPKEHSPALATEKPGAIRALAEALQGTLGALYRGLSNPAYNLVLHESPLRDRGEDYWHWHIEILPRLATAAGFELGTGIWINSVIPEEAADYLRGFVPARQVTAVIPSLAPRRG